MTGNTLERNRCFYRNSPISHTEILIHDHLYRFIDWLNLQWSLLVYMPAGRKKDFFFCITNSKTGGVPWYISVHKGFHIQRLKNTFWKTHLVDYVYHYLDGELCLWSNRTIYVSGQGQDSFLFCNTKLKHTDM